MDRMNIEVMRGFGVTRRRGTETGGVLLGKIDRREKSPRHPHSGFRGCTVRVCSGPSYVLSPADQQRFKEVVAKWQPSLDKDVYAVGYFRSHTRDGFALDDRDAIVFREFFPDPLDVALLVKPFATRAATAGFFLKEKGVLVTASTPMEFKFETRAGSPAGASIDSAPEIAPPKREPTAAPLLVGLLSQFRRTEAPEAIHIESCLRLIRTPRPRASKSALGCLLRRTAGLRRGGRI